MKFEYAEKIENSTTIAQDLFDMINATGWALYNGYGMINIFCRNGVSKKSLSNFMVYN